MKNKIALLLLLLLFQYSFGQSGTAYKIYNQKSKPISFDRMSHELSKYDVVLFGELHNNAINHWLELQVEKALFKKVGSRLILGAEMIERDNQKQLNEYLQGKIPAKHLKDSIRLWQNYETDYRPLIDFAKENKLRFVATNIPRRYASFVAKKGIDTLQTITSTEKEYMMHLPLQVTLETPGYEEMKSMMAEHAGNKVMNFITAQAVKDATMAESIHRSWKPNNVFLHFHGNFHSKEYGGIYWYLKKLNPKLKIAVITVEEVSDSKLFMPAKDFIPTEFNIMIPEDMTKTF